MEKKIFYMPMHFTPNDVSRHTYLIGKDQ